MQDLGGPYAKRPIRFIELVRHQGWRLKLYGIRYCPKGEHERPDEAVLQASTRAALSQLETPALGPKRYGVGFLVVHQGIDRNWILLDWWYEREILKQKLWSSPKADPNKVEPVVGDLVACTWELAVHAFERNAWVDTVLSNPAGPDLDAYCATRLCADI